MIVTAKQLRATPFETGFIPCRGSASAVQVTERGLRLRIKGRPDLWVETFERWHFHKRRVLIDDLRLRFSLSGAELFKKQFNLLRMRRHPSPTFSHCPCCDLLHPQTGGPVSFCSECLGMHAGDRPLCESDGYQFNFCQDGLFSLLGPTGSKATLPSSIDGKTVFRSLRTASRPLFDRMTSHLLWLALFILLFQFFPRATTPLIFLSLFLMGCYATLLLLRGAIKPYFFPPPWEVVAQKVRQGKVEEAEQWIMDEQLADQPGLAANLAIGYHRTGNPIKAREWLTRAHATCPSHPALSQLEQMKKEENNGR